MEHKQEQWQQANKTYLLSHLERLRGIVQRFVDGDRDSDIAASTRVGTPARDVPTLVDAAMSESSYALDTLCEMFHLSPFERDILLLCAGVELDSTFAPLCAAAQGDEHFNYPTFSLALAALPDAAWSALSPGSPLRYWHLIEIDASRSLTCSPLRIDERILHYLVGISYLDKQLSGLFRPLTASGKLVPSHLQIAQEIAETWSLAANATDAHSLPVVQLCGSEITSSHDIAFSACLLLEHSLVIASTAALPTAPSELEMLLLVWTREAALSNFALLLDCQGIDTTDTAREYAIARLIEANQGLLILSSPHRRTFSQRALLTLDVQKPTSSEQVDIWQTVLGKQAAMLNGQVRGLVSQFHLNEQAIHIAYTGTVGHLATSAQDQPVTSSSIGETLWNVCRIQARPRLDDLAQRIDAIAEWDDLVIPAAQRESLREIAMHLRYRVQVYETWGFNSKSTRGLGISALFAGMSGVGKTMAAEVLARELNLDLYRIDLSAVVSKYIGETEKNLRRVFDAAEEGGAILLFDEADALFGKRSEVKDSHDRYANIEVSYLLQRMEAYQGLAILTTNMKDTLDTAFLRRIRFIVQFPFPDVSQRAEIWRRIFPSAAPTDGLDMEKLAQLNVAGGNIRNISLNAAFIAANAGEPIRMQHVLRAARSEYIKLEKSLTSAETRGWNETTNS
jgi:predicted nucleic acid-binding protein